MVKNKDEREEDDLEEDDRDEEDRDEKSDGKEDDVEVDSDKEDDKGKGKEKEDEIEIIDDERIVDTAQVKKPESQESQEDKRERRRREKKEKVARRIAAERRDKMRIQQQARELEEVKRQLAEVKGLVPQFQQRMSSQEEMQIDNAMSQQKNVYDAALDQLNKAITEGNGQAAATAQRYIDDAKGKYAQLANLKQNLTNERQKSSNGHDEETEQQVTQPKIHEGEMLKIYRTRWVTENDWYDADPKTDDDDSKVARAIDKQLIKDGFDPNHRDFWTEFKTRLKEELPHLSEDEKEKTKSRPRPRQVNGSVGADSYAGESGKLRIPQRVVQMAKDAGLWDDEKKRKMFIANWKQQNGAAN